jgi:hypothetical protein
MVLEVSVTLGLCMISKNSLRMKKVYFGIVIFVVVLIYLFTAQRIDQNREEQFFIRFDTTNINGRLEYAKIGYHGSVFKIEGIEKEFIFYPITDELNDNKIFYNIAQKGDWIIKDSHSNILKVKKNEKVYLYKFQKPND